MKIGLAKCRFTLKALALMFIGLALILSWISHNYQFVQKRTEHWQQLNDPGFSVREAIVFKIEQAGITAYPTPKIPWIRRMLGDAPTAHLIYNPEADPSGAQLRRARELFPEAKIWGWQHIQSLPDGIERLTDQHYVRM